MRIHLVAQPSGFSHMYIYSCTTMWILTQVHILLHNHVDSHTCTYTLAQPSGFSHMYIYSCTTKWILTHVHIPLHNQVDSHTCTYTLAQPCGFSHMYIYPCTYSDDHALCPVTRARIFDNFPILSRCEVKPEEDKTPWEQVGACGCFGVSELDMEGPRCSTHS